MRSTRGGFPVRGGPLGRVVSTGFPPRHPPRRTARNLHLTGAGSATNGSALTNSARQLTVARPDLGMKRQCMNCGAKFYDLSRNPIVCPKCDTVFQAAAAAPARVAAPVAAARRPAVEEEPEVEAAGPELVSLEEVEAGEAEKDPVIEDDIEVAADAGGEDTFLEADEEGDDDVAGLIDGDIEEDDEP